VVIPELKKAAFIIGGEYGKGVMSCRAGDQWSAPVFMQLAKGSWGFQAGVEQADVVLLVMNDQGVQKLLQNKVNLGVDASVAAGPIGRRAGAGTDAALRAEILSYSRSQGLFAGIDLSGGVLRPDEDANKDVYGAGAAPRTILASREISAPPEASPFLKALGEAGSGTARPTDRAAATPSPAAGVPATPRTTTMPTTDDDLRARVVDIQQTVDRILADTTPAPVGTGGTTGGTAASGTVSVDRARLLQLRQQLDALLTALSRR
jgi:lipid-binding SYLF domain-containing protein